MKFFVEALIFAFVAGAVYYLCNIPHSSSVDMQYVKGSNDGGK